MNEAQGTDGPFEAGSLGAPVKRPREGGVQKDDRAIDRVAQQRNCFPERRALES